MPTNRARNPPFFFQAREAFRAAKAEARAKAEAEAEAAARRAATEAEAAAAVKRAAEAAARLQREREEARRQAVAESPTARALDRLPAEHPGRCPQSALTRRKYLQFHGGKRPGSRASPKQVLPSRIRAGHRHRRNALRGQQRR